MAQAARQKFLDIYQKHDGLCAYCGRLTAYHIRAPLEPAHLTATLDHIVPIARGGSNDKKNLALACSECNQHKGDAPPHIWKNAIDLHPEWWAKPGGGAALRRHLNSVLYPERDVEWPWLKKLMDWTLDHSNYGGKLFFTRRR